MGLEKPLPTVRTVEVEETEPFTATISFTALLYVSATKTLPEASTATPKGAKKPLPTVSTVELSETTPFAATISVTVVFVKSATKTLPDESTATPKGAKKPLPTTRVELFPGNTTCGAEPIPRRWAVAITAP